MINDLKPGFGTLVVRTVPKSKKDSSTGIINNKMDHDFFSHDYNKTNHQKSQNQRIFFFLLHLAKVRTLNQNSPEKTEKQLHTTAGPPNPDAFSTWKTPSTSRPVAV